MDSLSFSTSFPSVDKMKRPKKNERMDTNLPTKSKEGLDEEEEEEEEGGRRVRVGFRAKRERRQASSSATMCQVCNIRLNSSAQAQIHYRGKTHQRRLRRLAKAVSAGVLSQNQVHPLISSLPLPGRPLQQQTHAQLEHFLPLRVSGSSPLSLFPNFNTMDPVQKAVINHTFGMSQPRKKPIISCNICHLRFNSTTQAEAHYKGHKHARKLKAMETQKNRQKNGHSQPSAGKDRNRKTGMMEGETMPVELKDKTEITNSTSLSPLYNVDTQCQTAYFSTNDPNASSQPAEPHPESSQGNLQTTTPSSTPSCTDSSSPPSAHQTLQVSDGSQLSDVPSDGPHEDGSRAATSSASDSDPQGSPIAGEEEEATKEKEVKEAKNNKKDFHCPTCKVTVNSSSQLESHCSGIHFYCFSLSTLLTA
uniref:Zinc finger protein 385C-like n=1 Tax=Fundulus heteroclitus TaxID=8078 RepID=A0A3Q2P8Q8_FUNHE